MTTNESEFGGFVWMVHMLKGSYLLELVHLCVIQFPYRLKPSGVISFDQLAFIHVSSEFSDVISQLLACVSFNLLSYLVGSASQ